MKMNPHTLNFAIFLSCRYFPDLQCFSSKFQIKEDTLGSLRTRVDTLQSVKNSSKTAPIEEYLAESKPEKL